MEANNNTMIVTLTTTQLHDFMMEVVKEALQAIEPKKKETAKYLTRLEVCKALNISLPTLSRYSELGLIPAKRIGNRILYLQSDIEASLKDRPIRKLRP